MRCVRLDITLRNVLLVIAPLGTAGCSPCPDPHEFTAIVPLPDAGVDGSIEAGVEGGATCQSVCAFIGTSADIISCRRLADAGAVECTMFESHPACPGGRRPAGLSMSQARAFPVNAAAYFQSMAFLEAASVVAFHSLRDELALHGAPRRLQRAAARAADDEVRHAKLMNGLARRYGGRPTRVSVERQPARPLEDVAIENEIEGCVRETYGALVAMWQSHAAEDPIVRRAMRRIARDETRHAELSFDVAAWSAPRLSLATRARIEQARRHAARQLMAQLTRPVPQDLVRIAGLPSSTTAQRLAVELEREIWS
jgi:hypothetical protein